MIATIVAVGVAMTQSAPFELANRRIVQKFSHILKIREIHLQLINTIYIYLLTRVSILVYC